MSFVLVTPMAALMRKLALSESATALRRLRKAQPSDHDVHQVRKTCKRLRAWLVLLHEPLGARADGIEDLLRQAGRGLTESRESAVRRSTLRALAGRHPASANVLHAARALFEQCERMTAVPASTTALTALTAARDAIAQATLPDLDPAALERGLVAGYRRARKAMRRVKNDNSESVHEWRKKLRRHTDQSKLMSQLWPALAGGRDKQMKRLNDLLGDHHDLADLDHALRHIELDDEQRAQLRQLIADDQAALIHEARELAQPWFKTKARQWSPALGA